MRHLPTVAATALAALALMGSSPALAHAKLVSASPTADAKASNVRSLTLTFSTAIDEKQSGVEIVMTSMPGMSDHPPMKVSGFKTALGAEGKTLVVTLPRALPAGTYDLKWHAVTADTHRVQGSYSFSVK